MHGHNMLAFGVFEWKCHVANQQNLIRRATLMDVISPYFIGISTNRVCYRLYREKRRSTYLALSAALTDPMFWACARLCLQKRTPADFYSHDLPPSAASPSLFGTFRIRGHSRNLVLQTAGGTVQSDSRLHV